MSFRGLIAGRAMMAACASFAAPLALQHVAWAETTFVEEAVRRGLIYHVEQGAFGGPGQYGCGLALCDLDGDGDEDIVCSGGADQTLGLFRNNGAGSFTDVTALSGLGSPTKPSGIAAGDYDADGDLDLCVTRWLGPILLFRNDGGLHFSNVTEAAGITTPGVSTGGGAAWGDYDGDGWIDLVVANRTGAGAPVKNRLFRNLGNGTFADVAPALGVNDGFASFQASWCDIDRDGDLDMYVANDKGAPGLAWNRLYRNNGNGTFSEDPASGAQISIDAMGVCFGELTGDGFPEIFTPNVPSGNVLLKTSNGLSYTNATAAAGVAGFATCWGGIAFDPDHDGDTDLYFTSSSSGPDFLFEDVGAWPLLNRTAEWGLANLGEAYCHAIGDVDGDGDPDLLVQNREANLRLFINRAELLPNRRWVKLRPIGVGADRNALGLQVDVTGALGVQWRQAESGSAYKSQSSLVLHAGIGPLLAVPSIAVRWPNGGGERTLVGYESNRTWSLVPPAALGDFDGDGSLSNPDRLALRVRVDAPFVPGCEPFDFDGDADVDGIDELLFLRRYCDLDGDGAVGQVDLSELLGRWGLATSLPAEGDLDGDGVVGEGDLVLLLAGWGDA